MTPTILTVLGADQPTDLGSGQTGHSGATDLHNLFGSEVRTDRLDMTRHFFRQAWRPSLGQYDYVVNLITDPDQNPYVLDNLSRLLRGYRGRVINPPAIVLRTTRDKVAARLAGTPGLIVPKVARFKVARPEAAIALLERVGLAYPLIVRRAGTHGGHILGLCHNSGEVAACIEPGAGHFATEFVDYQSPDGLYRKARIFFIGDRMILRHRVALESWNVHAGDGHKYMLDHPVLLAEEERDMAVPEGAFPAAVHDVLREVRQRIGLDFFGIDFGLMEDGRLLLFEANATMNFLPFELDPRLEYTRRSILPAQVALWELVGLKHPATS
ncbi:MAG: hypothetical protein ABIR51_09855 [Sphingomicrobium sp.]